MFIGQYKVSTMAHLPCACNKTTPKGLQNTQNVSDNVSDSVQSPHKTQVHSATTLTPPSRLSHENR